MSKLNGRMNRLERVIIDPYGDIPNKKKGYIGFCPSEWDGPLPDDWEVVIHHAFACYRTEAIAGRWVAGDHEGMVIYVDQLGESES